MLAAVVDALPPSVRARREVQPLIFAATQHGDGRRAYFSTLMRNTRLLETARRILDAAEAAGVAMMPLKGALFAETLYGDAGARPMADLDLAVRPAQLDGAAALMRTLGFRPAFAPRARFSARHGHDVAFVDETGETVVEVHHRLFHELAVDAAIEPVFERAITVELWGRARRVPSWEDHLFVTAVHAATHAFDSPMWVVDVALLCARLASGGVEAAAAEAARREARVPFGVAMRLARRVLPSLPWIAPGPGERAREVVLNQVLGRDWLAAPPSHLASLLARVLLTDELGDALREIRRKLGLRAVELGERFRAPRR